MQKIMFNEKYGLETSVLNGTKTMTRRQFYIPEKLQYLYMPDDTIRIYDTQRAGYVIQWCDSNENVRITFYPKYNIGEVVAIAQSYKNISDSGYSVDSRYDSFRTENWDENKRVCGRLKTHHGWNNKMFVKADLMPHHIRITDVKAERLQDISEEDCLKEGIVDYGLEYDDYGDPQYGYKGSQMFINPIDAFRSLIDKVSGKETWNIDPYVWVYEFELID